MKWLEKHEIVEDNMVIIKGKNKHKKYHFWDNLYKMKGEINERTTTNNTS